LQQIKSYQIAQTVFTNTVSLIQFPPHNSSYRRLFLFWFTKGLSLDDSIECYGISKRTYNRLVEQKDSEIVARKYTIGVTKEMITRGRNKRLKGFWMIFFQSRAVEIIDIRRQLMENFTTIIEVK
jgi:hypothetical protein